MKHKKSKKKSTSTVAIPTFKIEQSDKADITANTGLFFIAELLDIIFRPGKDFTSTGAAQMLAENLRRLKPHFDEIILLADAGFYEQSIIEVCEDEPARINFIITSNAFCCKIV